MGPSRRREVEGAEKESLDMETTDVPGGETWPWAVGDET